MLIAWTSLPDEIQGAWEMLGYNAEMWCSDRDPERAKLDFVALSTTNRLHLLSLDIRKSLGTQRSEFKAFHNMIHLLL